MNEKQIIGSQTAKNGFKNKDDIVEKFNDWKKDQDAQAWLAIMKYKITFRSIATKPRKKAN